MGNRSVDNFVRLFTPITSGLPRLHINKKSGEFLVTNAYKISRHTRDIPCDDDLARKMPAFKCKRKGAFLERRKYDEWNGTSLGCVHMLDVQVVGWLSRRWLGRTEWGSDRRRAWRVSLSFQCRCPIRTCNPSSSAKTTTTWPSLQKVFNFKTRMSPSKQDTALLVL